METRVLSVLIVDIDPILRQVLVDYLNTFEDLRAAGSAKNAAEAIELCAKLKPDVILVDIQLPDMDGIKAIEAMRAHCPHAPMVILTQSVMFKRKTEAINAGAVTWLEKGVPIEDIIASLRHAAFNH